MNRIQLNETIVARATASGSGAIAVIRVSGASAIDIVQKIFSGKDLSKVDSHTIHFGRIVKGRQVIDEVLAAVYRAPTSYTRENIVEISCHGSEYIVQQIIQLLHQNGCQPASAGEFTLRAFLNGQMDLSQAEAVADLIQSDSFASHELAMKQMRGEFSNKLKDLRQELIDFASLIELELDFGEEDVEFANRDKLMDLVNNIQEVLMNLIQSFELGNVLKNGVATVIAGRPNAGKSTLLNALVNEERAIVSEIEGTTRDVIEETMNIDGVLFRFIDTAGIRDAQDKIESMGVERTFEQLDKSSVILYVVDVTTTSPEQFKKDIEQLDFSQSKLIVLLNKMDLYPRLNPDDYIIDGKISIEQIITLSAKNKMNIDHLKTTLKNLVLESKNQNDVVISNTRHLHALQKAHESLSDVMKGLKANITSDFVAIDIRKALHYLGEILGEVSTDDLLESIFSRFCIGK